MRRLSKLSLPGRWALYLGASLLCTAIVVLAGILPLAMQDREQTKTIAGLEQDLVRQGVLAPLHTAVLQELQSPLPVPKVVSRNLETPKTVEELPEYLGRMAQSCGITNFTFVPVPQSLDRKTERLAVTATLAASPDRMRQFLNSLSMAQDFERLQEADLSILGGKAGRDGGLQARLLFWVRLPKGDGGEV